MKHHTSPTLVCDRHDASRPTTLYEGLPSRLLTRPPVLSEDQPVGKALTDSATSTCDEALHAGPTEPAALTLRYPLLVRDAVDEPL